LGTFPAFGVGWVLSKEDFIANVKGIDLLKLRGGWGRLGNHVPLNNQAYSSGLSSYLGGSTLYEERLSTLKLIQVYHGK
jgi:hypothetical protein